VSEPASINPHHIAHYGIAAALAAALGVVYTEMPSPARDPWKAVTADKARVFADSVKGKFRGGVNVFCMETQCRRAASVIAKDMGEDFTRPLYLPNGLTVGSPTQEDADKLAKYVKSAFGIDVADAVPNQPNNYIAFGPTQGDK